MALELSHALAPTFTFTSASPDLRLTFASGASPVDVTVPTGTYRNVLGPSSGAGADFLRVLQGRINTALSGAGRGETVAVTFSATTGKVTLTMSGGSFSCVFGSYPAATLLGFNATVSAVTSATATYQPKYLALVGAREGGDFVEREPLVGRETASGSQSGWRSGITTWEDELIIPAIPRDASFIASYLQTPWQSEDLSTTRGAGHLPFTVSDMLAVSLGKVVAFADGNLRELVAGTQTRYYLGTIPAEDIARPRTELMAAGYQALRRWRTRFILRQTPTGTTS